MKKIILASLLTAGVAPGLALADADDETGDFSIFGGAHWYGEDSEFGVNDGPVGLPLDTGPIFGVRAATIFGAGFGIEGEVAFSLTGNDNETAQMLTGRAHFIYTMGNGRVRPFVLVGGGAQALQAPRSKTAGGQYQNDIDLTAHAGAGFKLAVQENWGLRFDGRYIVVPSIDGDGVTQDWEAVGGLYKSFGHSKAPVPVDSDGDGILDKDDQCPTVAEDIDGNEDMDGCPETEEAVVVDQDGDGVEDSLDQCPTEAEDKDGFEDDDGCPDMDNDGDGIEDGTDACPDEAEDKNGIKDEDGCPDAGEDDDGDGVPNATDKCPDSAETMNGFEDADGCEDELPKRVQKFVGTIKGIRFATGSAKVKPSSKGTLNAAIRTMNKFPSIGIQIIGHTDDQGDRDMNVVLSQQRADAVRAYLIEKGVAETRLTSLGRGPDEPLVPNTTSKNRAQNRRIEFKLAQ